MKKRFLAAALAAVMAVALLPAAALAADGDFILNGDVLENYKGPGGDVVIPQGVTSIGENAFNSREDITSVTIPEGVTTIGRDAFYLCTGLTSVVIPVGVTTIEEGAFAYCTGLTAVTIPKSVTAIGVRAFASCTGLTSVTIPVGVTNIEMDTFADCTALTGVTIPRSVTTIGETAFRGCTGLTSVTIPEGVTTLGNTAFGDCTGLTSVVIPQSVTTIGEDAFPSYGNLTIYCDMGSPAEQYCLDHGDVGYFSTGAGLDRAGRRVGKDDQDVAWSVTGAGQVTVNKGNMAEDGVILVGCYDDDGRLAKLVWMDAATAQIDPKTPKVKLFWMDERGKPQSPSVTVWGK